MRFSFFARFQRSFVRLLARATLRTGALSAATLLWLALPSPGCGRAAPDEDSGQYARRLLAARAEKDRAFRDGGDSPVPPVRRDEFLPLEYFPPDPDYSVPAALKLDGRGTTVQMPTSTGQMRAMARVGTLEFALKGRPLTLGAFVEAGSGSVDRLFVPFSDLTSGAETYPAGRYLDLDRTATGLYTLDFNRAYHPFCYYNPTYDCPFPPAENRLPIPIRAGERLKAGSQG